MITPFLNLSSLLIGLAAWGFGIRAVRRGRMSPVSFSLCILALVLQFIELTHREQIGDISAIMDTIRAITLAAVTLSAGTVTLNLLAHYRGRK